MKPQQQALLAVEPEAAKAARVADRSHRAHRLEDLDQQADEVADARLRRAIAADPALLEQLPDEAKQELQAKAADLLGLPSPPSREVPDFVRETERAYWAFSRTVPDQGRGTQNPGHAKPGGRENG